MSNSTTNGTSIHLSSSQILRDEFWPYGAGVLIASGVCLLIFLAIWRLDKMYEAKEFGIKLLVWVWGMWWTIVFWPFQVMVKVDRLLSRGLGRDRDGRRIVRDMEEC
ncbi:hypothetical protein EG329_004145 [Mollisiaceae sp. DMI_Dod_QoI]|nr:hypothetical protein EG329_004145 [Helotiales sp. DMI_Dod_QoI]